MSSFVVGEVISGVVTGIEKYGFFVSINKKFTGLVHISEISDLYVKDISDYVFEGEKIFAKIVEIDEKSGQMKLSIKNMDYRFNTKNTSNNVSFESLKSNLPLWIEEKLNELE